MGWWLPEEQGWESRKMGIFLFSISFFLKKKVLEGLYYTTKYNARETWGRSKI